MLKLFITEEMPPKLKPGSGGIFYILSQSHSRALVLLLFHPYCIQSLPTEYFRHIPTKPPDIPFVMMLNKLQTAEDIENFRRLQEIETILKGSPYQLVDAVADVPKVFLLKMNVPVPETEKLTDKVREKKMGELFADMEKMDIQAERQNTAIANKRADRAEKQADKAEKRTDEAAKNAAEALSRATIAEENEIKSIVEVCQELGGIKRCCCREAYGEKEFKPGALSE